MINNELTRVVVRGAVLNIERETVELLVQLPDGSELRIAECKLYWSPSDYEMNKTQRPDLIYTIADLLGAIGVRADGSMWVMGESGPEQVSADVDVIIYKNGEYKAKNDLPAHYLTRDDAIEDNDYTVVEGDGTKRLHLCVKNKLALTPEQEDAVDALRAALAACGDKGVRLLADIETERLFAVNGAYIDAINWDADGPNAVNDLCASNRLGEHVPSSIEMFSFQNGAYLKIKEHA